MLDGIFPLCEVVNWQPMSKKLKGRVKQAVDKVHEVFKDDLEDFYAYKDLMHDLGMSDPSNFSRNVRAHANFQQYLAEHSLEEGEHRRRRGIQPATSGFMDDDPKLWKYG